MKSRRTPKQAGERLSTGNLLTFIELKPFTKSWEVLGLTDDDLMQLQLAILSDPSGPPIIENCAGIRKLRFSPGTSAKGKRGGIRCCFKFFEELGVVILALAYPKSAQENLTPEDKRRLRTAIQIIELELKRK